MHIQSIQPNYEIQYVIEAQDEQKQHKVINPVLQVFKAGWHSIRKSNVYFGVFVLENGKSYTLQNKRFLEIDAYIFKKLSETPFFVLSVTPVGEDQVEMHLRSVQTGDEYYILGPAT